MKSKTRKIGKVASLAASEERRFGEQAGRSQQHLNDQLERLGELNAYRHNYAQKVVQTTGISAAHWKDYQGFLRRLDTALQAQQQIVRDCEQNAESHRQRWLSKRRKLESLERVLEKYRQQDSAHQDRMEQKSLDDIPNSQAGCFEPDD